MARADKEVFRWTGSEGRVALGQVPGDVENTGRAMSSDGSVIVGESKNGQ